MIDSVQLILFVVISVLTILLVVLGIQVFFILKEIRKAVEHANNVLSNAHSITDSISRPLSSLSSFSTGFKAASVVSAAKIIKNLLAKDDESSGKKAHKE